MENKSLLARELHLQGGCNCAQAVVVAYADELHIDKDVAFKLTEGLGRGCAGEEGICGALTSCIMILGMLKSAGLEGKGKTKLSTYELTKKYLEAFKEYDGSIYCHELKAKRIAKTSKDKTCNECVGSAINVMHELLDKEKEYEDIFA